MYLTGIILLMLLARQDFSLMLSDGEELGISMNHIGQRIYGSIRLRIMSSH